MKLFKIIQLLLLSVGFTFSLLIFRMAYYDSRMYLFLIWNIFLAGIPLLASTFLPDIRNYKLQALLFTVWLPFFPNSLYIITDLVHLKNRPPVPFWFDIILVFSAAFNGLVIAYTSLYQIEIFLYSKFNKHTVTIILLTCLFLGSFGVYLGRYLRWNSWNIVTNPFGIITEISKRFFYPFDHPRTWGLTIIFTAFFSVFYFTIKKLPGLVLKSS